MSFFDSISTSASALTAQRLRMDVISENIANVNTTKAADGNPYKRKTVLFEERSNLPNFSSKLSSLMPPPKNVGGVKVSKISRDDSPGDKVYDPSHPDADPDGYLTMPNVNIVTEMVNMISASRSYEANITAINTTKTMMAKTMEISR